MNRRHQGDGGKESRPKKQNQKPNQKRLNFELFKGGVFLLYEVASMSKFAM